MEHRLSDTVFTSVPQRIAATPCTLAGDEPSTGAYHVALTHEQLAALTGTPATPSPRRWASSPSAACSGLSRAKITVLDRARLAAEAGNP
jgi:CRP/FNR family transcriptional regulator, cyclic AMP receptor protein